ncbi:MAG: pantetheine-phosphate adenylyltransferase [Candidatus Aminicenantes bacterium]|nr:pantetheine-phosphate adenylyltransferase [Candidatus Aminicenantes bacterium]MCK5004950.1 pantetheine-phosphate adenylyltransferase [Candidatus Aminicenantes bacterium]
MGKRTAIYPGSYDPLTNGHIDIIERGLDLFDKIIVTALKNPGKTYLFTLEERMAIMEETFKGRENIEIDYFEGLLADYLERKNTFTVVRGLRAISDFEIEFQMALMNRSINDKIETIFLVPSISYSFLSSKLVKEIYKFGGEIKSMVPDIVDKKLKEKYSKK